MGGFSIADENASIRGYILRCLVKGSHFCYSVSGLSNKLMNSGLISNTDISKHLYYLANCKLICFTDSDVTAFNAM